MNIPLKHFKGNIVEIDLHQPSLPTTGLNTFTKYPRNYLSVKDACKILQNRQVIPINPNIYSFNSKWKTAALMAFMIGLLGGFSAFASISDKVSSIDHSRDFVSKYICVKEYMDMGEGQKPFYKENCSPKNGADKYGISEKDGMIIDHSNDTKVMDYVPGIKAMIPISIAPPIFVCFIWTVLKLYQIGSTSILEKRRAESQERVEDMIISLETSALRDKNMPVPNEFISELIDYGVLGEDQYKLLSFDQIKRVKKDRVELFNELLTNQNFSTDQNLNWNKLEKLLAATPEKIAIAIQNQSNNNLFEKEPKILETLIQNIPNAHLTENVKTLLAMKIERAHSVFSTLQLEERTKIVELISEKNYSFEEAYKNFQMSFLDIGLDVNLQFNDENQNLITLQIPVGILCASSKYFAKMLKGEFKESTILNKKEPILMRDVSPCTFQKLINYLKTEELKIENELDCLDLLEIAIRFEFTDLLAKLELILCNNLKSKLNVEEIADFMDFSENFNLKLFKDAIDLRISEEITRSNKVAEFFSDHFLKILPIITKFSLRKSLSRAVSIIKKNVGELSKNEEFIPRFVNIIGINNLILNKIFPSIISLFFDEPKLLKILWDEAFKQNNEVIQDEILLLSENLDYTHIFLANWALPPKKALNQNFEIVFENNECIELDNLSI